MRIVLAVEGAVPEPIKKFEMDRTLRKAWEGNVCEFCQRNETEVMRLIPGDEFLQPRHEELPRCRFNFLAELTN